MKKLGDEQRAVMTRRDLVKLGAAGLAAAGMAGCASFGRGMHGDPAYRGLKVGVHTFSLRAYSFEKAVAITKGLGVHYIGLKPKYHTSVDDPPEKLAAERAYIKNAGLHLMACGVMSFKASDPAGARKTFEYAKAMGMPVIVANLMPEDVGMLDPLVDEFGIRIAIHNHGPSSNFPRPEDLLRAIRGHHKYIGACVDIGHYTRAGVKAEDALAALADRAYDMHLKDVSKAAEDGHTVVIGKGVIDFDAVAEQLLKMRFGYHVALEYESEKDNPVPSMRESLINFRKILNS
ncbi:MAG: sugar phosphate isomerase/epimerase [Candidatus Hydrogenedentes bacterium]|nr:sugar phosphate isomerase/epimerase [Candidatus Hydrogenedentota bacterium]